MSERREGLMLGGKEVFSSTHQNLFLVRKIFEFEHVPLHCGTNTNGYGYMALL